MADQPWTLEAYMLHSDALRVADAKFHLERDRRYTEVNIEKEKALKIKETADLAALGLAREIQTYKDEKANQLREQINSERGSYLNRTEAKPLFDYVSSQQGSGKGSDKTLNYLLMALVATNIIINLFIR